MHQNYIHSLHFIYKKRGTCVPPNFALMYSDLFTIANLNAATAEKQRAHKNQASWVDAKAKVLHFATAAAQKQQNEQNPCAVATTVVCVTALATAVAMTIVKQSVEHFLVLLFIFSTSKSIVILTYHSLLYNMVFHKKVLQQSFCK